ncbi:hypothetical protein ACFX2I_045251 [Malus domestica]
MDLIGKNAGAVTPVKNQHGSRSKKHDNSRYTENSNPNVSPGPKPTASPASKSTAKSQKSASKNANPVVRSPRNKIRERKFVVAKKKSKKENPNVACKCKEKGNSKMCLCVAYENLRASQEEFFKKRNDDVESESLKESDRAERELEEAIEEGLRIQDVHIEDGSGDLDPDSELGCSTIKRRRDKLLEEARKSVPERGKVMHLVQAFEKLLSIPSSKDSDEQNGEEEAAEEIGKKVEKWTLPGLQPPPNEPETQVSSLFFPSDLCLTSENLGLDRRPSVSSSWDGSLGSGSSRTSNGGRRNRRNSSESSSTMGGTRWKKKRQQRATSAKPFKLRTEERGRQKEEEFVKKLQEMMMEEERQRIPIAQGLPWTTDEPECLLKPPVKEITIPTDLKLHSDMRAVERAEFDHQVAEKMSLFEQYKMERERLQKLAEEEEIRRLRKELVPKAQPMPYFDRPFIPRRSMKHPTIPKEPKFHVPQNKKIKCCLSWNDMSSYTYEH